MKKVLAGTFSFILVLGILAVAIYKTTGINMSYISKEQYGIGMYIFSVKDYVLGLRETVDQILGVKLLTTPQYVNLQWTDFIAGLKSIGNIFINGINTILLFFNLILATVKIGFYIILIVAAIFGINNTNLNILVFANYFYTIEISYIPPIAY